ncbi:MAG: hypothetical protein GWP07_04075 [Xanthomonadaceae bacterium]|nr:hypothetical protein [Xanthomonadaceae bacterium]
MSDSATKTGKSVLKKITYESGRLCRVATRQVKLSSIRRQRKHYFQNLGERLYIFKVLQKEDNVWDKEEISQLLLTLSDLDQEQELLLQEINEIKAGEMAASEAESCTETAQKPAVDNPVAGGKSAEKMAEKSVATDSAAAKPVKKSSTTKKATTKTAASTAKKPRATSPRAPRKKPAAKTSVSEGEKKE